MRIPAPRAARDRGLTRPPACRLRLVLLVLLVLLGSAGCRPQVGTVPGGEDIELTWSVTPAPPATGPARFSAALADARTRQPVRGAVVKLEGDMSHPGMKPVFGTAREIAPGRYEAPIEFTMAGDWVLLLDATLADGRTLQRQVLLPGVRARQAR